MKIISIGFFSLAGMAVIAFGFFSALDPGSGPDSTANKLVTDAPTAGVTTHPSDEIQPIRDNPVDPNNAPGRADDVPPATTAGPETARGENHVETFLTSAELNTLHTQLLARFSDSAQSNVGESLSIRSLGLDRSQRLQLFLEADDEIIRINNTPVSDLATNPAVGSLLAGPKMALSVQREAEVFEIDLSSY